MKRATLDAIARARAAQRPAVLLTNLKSNDQKIVEDSDYSVFSDKIADAIRAAVRADKSRIVDTADGPVFVQVFNPPLRLIIVGAVHIAQALAPVAALAGYAVTVVDPRRAFATDERFPGVAVSTEWPDEALAALAPDARTAVVTLTHDPKLDDPALAAALRSDCFYIGALGSKRTHAARIERLTAAGFDAAAQARIHGPVGLAIGARSPAEIAVAILAQITEVLRKEAKP